MVSASGDVTAAVMSGANDDVAVAATLVVMFSGGCGDVTAAAAAVSLAAISGGCDGAVAAVG